MTTECDLDNMAAEYEKELTELRSQNSTLKAQVDGLREALEICHDKMLYARDWFNKFKVLPELNKILEGIEIADKALSTLPSSETERAREPK